MQLIDHTNPDWRRRVKRINGAFTYSQDLVTHQIPLWEKYLSDDDIISTCPKFCDTDIEGRYRTAIQYLHSYPYINPVNYVAYIKDHLPFKTDDIIFISAYKDFAAKLNQKGFKAVHIPMSIDAAQLPLKKRTVINEKRIIYFGNVVQAKFAEFARFRRVCLEAGWEMDYISHGKFNGVTPVSQQRAFQIISTYKYGVAVGRCAQEMMAIGLQILILGKRMGGIMFNPEDYQLQLDTNMNGRIVTGFSDVRTCLDRLHTTYVSYNDIRKMDHPHLLKKVIAA